jgi:hypothetical protein
MWRIRGRAGCTELLRDNAEGGVDDIEVGIDPHRRGEEARTVAGVAVEEVAIVEIAIGAGISNRLRRLMDRKIVGLTEHYLSPACPSIAGLGRWVQYRDGGRDRQRHRLRLRRLCLSLCLCLCLCLRQRS